MKARKFTLMELLTVIGIIMILASMLLPALKRARGVAQSIYCKGNMRQQGIAFGIYENDYNVLPAPSYQVGSGITRYWGGILMDAGILKTSDSQYFGAVASNCKILDCPIGKDIYSLDRLGWERWNYGMNNQLCRLIYKDLDLYRLADRCDLFLPRQKISKPSQRLLLGEEGSTVDAGVAGTIGGSGEEMGPSGGSAYPHSSRMNILYVDFHVSDLSRKEMQSDWRFYKPLFGTAE